MNILWVWFAVAFLPGTLHGTPHVYLLLSLLLSFRVMVEPSSVAEEALRKITARLKCSVCLDTYTNAKLLPCFHSFCKRCLERLVVQDRNGHTLTCPNCRRTTPLPPAGVLGLRAADRFPCWAFARDSRDTCQIERTTKNTMWKMWKTQCNRVLPWLR